MNDKKALLIVDVQVAMFADENNKLYNGENVLSSVCLLLKKAREKGIPIVFIQHTEDEGEYKRGEVTWNLHPDLDVREGEFVVEKNSWDAFHETTLSQTLKELGVNELITAGMQTEFCLDTTCRRAYSLGYKNTLVKDAHSTFDSEVLKASQIVKHHNNILGGRFVSLKNLENIQI